MWIVVISEDGGFPVVVGPFPTMDAAKGAALREFDKLGVADGPGWEPKEHECMDGIQFEALDGDILVSVTKMESP